MRVQVLAFNGAPVRSLKQLAELVLACTDPFMRFDLEYHEARTPGLGLGSNQRLLHLSTGECSEKVKPSYGHLRSMVQYSSSRWHASWHVS
jgi:hypothetical protein